MLTRNFSRTLLLAAAFFAAASCTQASSKQKAIVTDTAFTQMQERGKMAMGVDQYTSSHHFEATPSGGRIELQRDTADSLGVAQIRAHMRLIQHAFEAGDFSTPSFVHMKDMPGTAVMAAKRGVITYTYADLPRGAEVRIESTDPDAIAAIHAFLDAQRMEHHAH